MVKKNRKKASLGSVVFDVCLYIFLAIVVLLVIAPVVMVLWKSMVNFRTDESGVKQYFLEFISYKAVFSTKNLLNSYLLQIFVVIVSTILAVLINAMMAYTLVAPGFSQRTKKVFTFFIFVTMIFAAGTIPYYITVRDLGLKDNILVYILPFLANGFNVMILRNFFWDVPRSIDESARLDGASDFTILFRIYFPLSKPSLVTVGLWFAVSKWNDWFTGTVFITKPELYVMQNVLRSMLIENFSGRFDPTQMLEENKLLKTESVQMAAVVVTVIPLLIVYPFVQKYFIKGVFVGGVKE